MIETDLDLPTPRAIDAERAILGSVLATGAIGEALDDLDAPDFFVKAHRTVYAAMLTLVEAGTPVDFILLQDELRKADALEAVGGPEFLAALEGLAGGANLAHYAAQVKETARLRATITTSDRLQREARQGARPAVDIAADYAERLQGIGGMAPSTKPTKLSALLTAGIEQLEQAQKSGGRTGIATGYTRLDDLTAGLQPTDLILVAARPGQGKTALAMNIARTVSKTVPAIVFSMEMSKHQLFLRMMSSESRVDSHRMRMGWLHEEDWPKLSHAIVTLDDAQLYIDDTPSLTVRDVRRRAKALKDEHGLGLIVIDYVQLMKGQGENRTQEVGSISHGLKALAKEISVPILALCQLSRASEATSARKARRPQLSDLRESGDLEADADVVVMIYRAVKDDDGEDDAVVSELLVRKQRNGPTGVVKVEFDRQCVRFDNPRD